MKQNKPIAIFDSGIGGLTVYRELKARLPHERFIYLGDTARLPYGSKSAETVIKYSLQNAEFLVSLGVKMLVVACNTASSFALDALVDRFDMPIVGVIASGVRRALALTRKARVGVIATESTVGSASYQNLLRELGPQTEVYAGACPLFVPLVEEGWLDHPVTREVARLYLEPLRAQGVDTLILGCTHYPLLKGVIAATLGPDVQLVDSAAALAGEISSLLTALSLERRPEAGGPAADDFYVTDSIPRFQRVAEIFLARELDNIRLVDLGAAQRRES
ncbi:MAG TPA: glutamate racemase [Acidobacteriota bacterium]|nr:glutamate racemase [Acidobacteriota bacterium]